MKKILSFVIIISLIFTSIIFAKYDGNDEIISNWDAYKKVNKLDSSLPYKTSKGQFNKELWEEKKVVVYGDYSLVPNNDFKTVSSGYYIKNGSNGEYRFHGYDVNGNKHNNTDFPPDREKTGKLEDKKFVYHPWEVGSVGNRLYQKYVGKDISKYNQEAIKDNKTIAKWINQGFDFDIKRITGTTINNPPLDPMHYITVQTPPTPISTGQGTFVHIDETGNDWYQTLPIKKIQDKEITPVEALIPSISVVDINKNGDVTLNVKVTGKLLDESYYKDEILKSTYYTRKDIKKWTFKLKDDINKQELLLTGKKSSENSAYAEFKLTLKLEKYKAIMKANNSFDVNLLGVAELDFFSQSSERKYSKGDAKGKKNIQGKIEEIPPPVKPEPEKYKPIQFDITAEKEILDVWKLPVTLTVINNEKEADRYVVVNDARLSIADTDKFLSGKYQFPEIREDKIYDYKVVFEHEDGSEYIYQSFVVVYDSHPRATVRLVDPGKVNRKVTATADKSLTSDFLETHSNVQISKFTITTDNGQRVYYGENTSEIKEFLLKDVGTAIVNVIVSNEYGARTYEFEAYQMEDYAPDLVAIIWNNNLSRVDELDMLAEGASLDADTVKDITYSIYYDQDKDEKPEKLLKSGVWNGTMDFTPSELGNYKVVLKVKEEFGQETIPQHITDADKKETTVEREFFVDNLIPMTKVYTDIEYKFPELEVMILNDESLPRKENDYIKEHQVDITNQFRVNSMIADIDTWDLYTYQFNQTAYNRINTGSSYPPSTIQYSNGGYSGTLSRYDIDNNSYQRDEGRYVSKTESKTASDTRYQSGECLTGQTVSNNLPSSVSYSSDGYSGTLSQYDYSYTSSAIYNSAGKEIGYRFSRKAYYSGTVYRTTTVWESNYVTYNDYYGDYSGTVYKNVKQSYTPELQTDSTKYIVYITNNNINNLADFKYINNIARDANIILVSNSNLKGQLKENHFINYSTDTQSIIDKLIDIAKVENPIANELAILVNEKFNLSTTDIDAESDPIIEKSFQYIHTANYFDNSLGQETNTYVEYADNQFTSTMRNSFSKPGKYVIYRRIKDEPTNNVKFGKYSNLSTLELVVHRKPIAKAKLDWQFDASLGVYKTTWVDQSYDPDFQYSDKDRGITDRSIRYRLTSSNQWIYEIPDNLSPGTYILEYVVKDKHNVSSDPFVMNFTLDSIPSVQVMDAKLRTKLSKFSLQSIPASEDLYLYDVTTRYPYRVYLEIGIYKYNIIVKDFGKITNGIIIFNNGDWLWNSKTLNIPETLKDDDYKFRVYAKDVTNTNKYAYREFDVSVRTPVNLKASLSNLSGGEQMTIKATTSRYVNKVDLTLFKGTNYEECLTMKLFSISSDTNTWVLYYVPPTDIPENFYNAEFNAYTRNGNSEKYIKSFYMNQLKIVNMNIIGYWNHWRGQKDIFNKKLPNMPHRFLSYEKVKIYSNIIGRPDEVTVRFSPELEAMYFTNKNGKIYSYQKQIGYTVKFPLKMTDNGNNMYSIEYILPLANNTIDNYYSTNRIPNKSAYWIEITAKKGRSTKTKKINDIDITGSTTDHIFMQR